MARRGVLLPYIAVAATLCISLCFIREQAQLVFLPPLRGETAAAGLAAAIVAGSVAGPLPAEAISAKFDIFGFGSSGYSDPYAANDADAYSPYSQFSNPNSGEKALYDDSVVKARADQKKTALKNSFGRIEKIPEFIKNRQGEEIKSTLTLQTYVMRANMEFLSGGRNSVAFQKARDFFQDCADIGVGARDKRWPLAQESYEKAQRDLNEWKRIVSF